MKNDSGHIDYDRLTAYIAGEGSVEEQQTVKGWIEASDENRGIYEQYKKIFELDYNSDINTETRSDPGVVFDTDMAWNKVSQRTKLRKKDSKVIHLPPDSSIEDHSGIKSFPWLKIAASVLIGMSLLLYFVDQKDSSEVVIAFDKGINEYYLPDSSKVVLQGASEIVYNKDFNDNHRMLRFEGKAYFDVERKEQLPFIVDTEHGQVKVLGTAFLIEENEENMVVEVERGKVSLSSHESNLKSGIILVQSEKGILDIKKNDLHKSILTDLNHLYWANHKLTYRQESLRKVLDELNIIFNKEILYDSSTIADCRVTAIFKDQKFEDILKNISISLEFDYIISGNQVEITSNGCHTN